MKTITQEEMLATLRERFGEDPKDWAFICPNCGTISTGADFRAALDAAGHPEVPASTHLGQECIGRVSGALKREQPEGGYPGPGCDWTAYGLFRGPVQVSVPVPIGSGQRSHLYAFEVAPAPIHQPDKES